jgi:hypothetical protein
VIVPATGITKLYTPDLLSLAVSLAEFPLDPAATMHGAARSATCGSTVSVGYGIDPDGRLEGIGMRVSACAVGQAAAALFAKAACGRSLPQIAASRGDIEAIRLIGQAGTLWLAFEHIRGGRARSCWRGRPLWPLLRSPPPGALQRTDDHPLRYPQRIESARGWSLPR